MPIARITWPPIACCAPNTCSTRALVFDLIRFDAFCSSVSGWFRAPFSWTWLSKPLPAGLPSWSWVAEMSLLIILRPTCVVSFWRSLLGGCPPCLIYFPYSTDWTSSEDCGLKNQSICRDALKIWSGGFFEYTINWSYSERRFPPVEKSRLSPDHRGPHWSPKR